MNRRNLRIVLFVASQAILLVLLAVPYTRSLSSELLTMAGCVFALVCDLMLIRSVETINISLQKEAQIRAEEEKLNQRLKMYSAIMNEDTEVRRLYHDLNNHLLTIQALKAAGRTQEAQDYIARVKETYGPHSC